MLVYRLVDSKTGATYYQMVVNASNRAEDPGLARAAAGGRLWAGRARNRFAARSDVRHRHDRRARAEGGRADRAAVRRSRPWRCATTTRPNCRWPVFRASRSRIVSRTGYTGEDGWELVVPARRAVRVWRRLLEIGEPLGAQAAGLAARDTLRLEAAMPLYGHELIGVDPSVSGRAWTSPWSSKDDYFPGRDALEKARREPSRVIRVGWKLDGKRVPREGYPVLAADGSTIGHVTSGTFSPTLEVPIAMGYCQPAFAQPGTEVLDRHSRPARAGDGRGIAILSPRQLSRFDSAATVISTQEGYQQVTPDKLLYAKTHEWVSVDAAGAKPAGGRVATIGISAFAVEALTDLVYIELPKVGRQVKQGESFGEIESVKAVSDLYSPVDGEIVAVNERAGRPFGNAERDPYGQGWIVKIKISDETRPERAARLSRPIKNSVPKRDIERLGRGYRTKKDEPVASASANVTLLFDH